MSQPELIRVTCPCCGYVAALGLGENCGVCGWERDYAQEADPDLTDGANSLSLREAQANVRAMGVSDLQGGRPPHHTYPKDPGWRPVAEARDLSNSPLLARKAFERLELDDSWSFTGESRTPGDVDAAVSAVVPRLAGLGLNVTEATAYQARAVRALICDWQGATFRVLLHGEPVRIEFGVVSRRVLTAIGPEQWGECVVGISEALGLDLARSWPAMISVADLQDDESAGRLAFVDWIQYWSAPIVERWGLDTLRRGPFARVDARANGAAAIWLARDPFNEPMSRAAAAEFLGLSLPKIVRRDPATSEWVAVPWP